MGYAKRVEIRWRDLDGFGHVNNAVFLTYLEEARDEFYTGLLSHDTVNQMVLRHTSVDFRRSLVQSDDLVDVALVVIRVGSSSVVTRETITSSRDRRGGGGGGVGDGALRPGPGAVTAVPGRGAAAAGGSARAGCEGG